MVGKIRFRVDWFDREINNKDLLEILNKIFYGMDSQFPLSACHDVVLAFIKELEKETKENNNERISI